MNIKLRAILIGFLSLAAVLAIYSVYSRTGKKPQIDIDTKARPFDAIDDGNAGEFDNEIGKFANVGITALKKPVYRHISKGRVDRELGFDELLREEKGEWEIEKPFLNIYQKSFKCFVKADGGKIQVEDSAGKASPKDAIFTGNVVVHILPEAGSDIKESFIYLSDVIFVKEKSLFSTAGPVRFVSQNAQMLGTGLELIYNEQLGRLELFRIVHLAAIHYKGSTTALFSRTTQDSNGPAKSSAANGFQKPNDTPTTAGGAVEQRQGEYFKCVLSKNVVIDSPEQLVFAKDKISINKIFWSKASAEEPNMLKAPGGDEKASDVAITKDNEQSKSAQAARDTIITCENGIFIIPMDSAVTQDDFNQAVTDRTNPVAKPSSDFNDSKGQPIFITDRIDYDASTDNAVATGPLELTLFVSDAAKTKEATVPAPMNITAQKEAKFLSSARQVTFEDNCLCTMIQAEPNNIRQKYTLSAPKLIVNLTPEEPNSNSRIEHLAAEGGVVKLQGIKTVKSELLSGVDLECRRAEYDVGSELFTATGAGTIRVNNSKASEPNQQSSRFTLRRPCFAFVRDFDTLKYFFKDNLIIADAEPGRTLRIDYFPVVAGSYGKQVRATAVHAEVGFAKAVDSQDELSMLFASDRITYKEDDGNEFLGGKLFYDREKSIMRVEGDQDQPCYLNGALAEKIIYDPKTGKFEAPLSGPSTLQIK